MGSHAPNRARKDETQGRLAVKRSKHITLDDLPPKYREQAERQLKGDGDAKDAVKYMHEIDEVLSKAPPGSIVYAHSELKRLIDAQGALKATGKESLQVRKDRKPKVPNKTEQLFNREMLGGLGMYEAITLKLPGNSRYTGDWVTSVFDPQEQRYETTVYEVKGTYRLGSHGRALTAFREARAAFPFLTFKWYEKQKGGGWIERYKQ